MEIEKEITPELAEKYKAHADKERQVYVAPPLTQSREINVVQIRWQR